MIGLIAILLVGGFLGWLASLVMRTHPRQGVVINVFVGAAGALLGGALLTWLIGGASITTGAIDARSLLVSFLGAVILLAIVNAVRRRSLR